MVGAGSGEAPQAMERNCLIRSFTRRRIFITPSCLMLMMTLVTTTKVTMMRLDEIGRKWGRRRRRSPEMPAGGNARLPQVGPTLSFILA